MPVHFRVSSCSCFICKPLSLVGPPKPPCDVSASPGGLAAAQQGSHEKLPADFYGTWLGANVVVLVAVSVEGAGRPMERRMLY